MNSDRSSRSLAPSGLRAGVDYLKCMNAVFDAPLSSSAEKLVLLYLLRRSDAAGESFPAHKTIAKECVLSVATVKRALGELSNRGLVEINTRRGRWGGGTWAGNSYKIAHPELLRLAQIAHHEALNSSKVPGIIAQGEPLKKPKKETKKEAKISLFSSEENKIVPVHENGNYSKDVRINTVILEIMRRQGFTT